MKQEAVTAYKGPGPCLGVRAKPTWRRARDGLRRCVGVQVEDGRRKGMMGGPLLSAAAGDTERSVLHWAGCCIGLRVEADKAGE